MQKRAGLTGIFLAIFLGVLLAGCASKPPVTADAVNEDSSAMINARLGLTYLQQGNFEVAESKLRKALESEPELLLPHLYIAELYNRTRRFDLAEEHFRIAMKLAPSEGLVHNNYGVYLCSRRQYAEAEQHFLKAAEARGYRVPDEALENAALCVMGIPDAGRAETHLRRALELNPRRVRALYMLAELKYEQGDFLSARGFVERLYAVAPKTPATLWLGVRIEQKLGADREANRLERELLEQFPDSKEAGRLNR